MNYLWNPLTHDVETSYNLDGEVHSLKAKAEAITEFDNETLFNHIRQYLIEVILNERGIIHFDVEREKVKKEVTKDFE